MWRRINVSFAEDPIPKFPTAEDREKEKMRKKLKELKVLFVSRRDSCRGPMAECIFDHINDKFVYQSFAKFDWRADSAGMIRTRHGGHLPDPLALRVLKENNLETSHGVRQVWENNKSICTRLDTRRPWRVVCFRVSARVWWGGGKRARKFIDFFSFWVDSTFRFHPIRLYPLHGALAVSEWMLERIVISQNK